MAKASKAQRNVVARSPNQANILNAGILYSNDGKMSSILIFDSDFTSFKIDQRLTHTASGNYKSDHKNSAKTVGNILITPLDKPEIQDGNLDTSPALGDLTITLPDAPTGNNTVTIPVVIIP